MARVICMRAKYEVESLRRQLFEMMDSLIGDQLKAGSRVLIKPNLLAPATPDRAMLTHPLIVRVVVEYVIRKGARPQISDSPAMGSFEKILKDNGIKEELHGLEADCREFKSSVPVSVGEPFGKLEIAEDALNADMIINLPKLKTHSQMLLTLGVKNLFGCVVGLRKSEWHFRTGVDRDMFAALLVRICQKVKPALTILDGILAMEGPGPGKGGVPRHLGVLMGSTDAVSLDVAVCRMLSIDADRLLTNQAAERLGARDSKVEIEGDMPLVKDFDLPEITPLIFGPSCMHGLIRKHLTQRPVSDESLCRMCGECWKFCPAQAISHDPRKVLFDYDKCIRCYCCLEVCPHGALKSQEPLLGKVFTKIITRSA